MIVFSGPWEGGKTTTLYRLASCRGHSRTAEPGDLEDPRSAVTWKNIRIAANPAAGSPCIMCYLASCGDPEVIAVVEIRDLSEPPSVPSRLP